MTTTTTEQAERVRDLVRDIHDAIAALAGVARYPDLTEAIDQLAALATPPAAPAPCIGRDPLCPCRDGDTCHYVATKKTPAFAAPPQAEPPTSKPLIVASSSATAPTAPYTNLMSNSVTVNPVQAEPPKPSCVWTHCPDRVGDVCCLGPVTAASEPEPLMSQIESPFNACMYREYCKGLKRAASEPAAEPFVKEALRLAEKMMRQSWATGDDKEWLPFRDALKQHLSAGPEPVRAEPSELRKAAVDVVARWDSPNWALVEHTGVVIDRLRKALSTAKEMP